MSGQIRTLRRPVRANTQLVKRALDRLEEGGASWAPRFIGVSGDQEVLTWLPGRTIDDWWLRPDLLDELAATIRQLHDMTASLALDHECLVHDDLQPRNVVVDGHSLGIVDWEQLRPGRRVEDVAQLCWSFATGPPGGKVRPVGHRWRQVADAYGLDDRRELVDVALAKIGRCVGDIVRGATQGSDRHRGLLDRGDHHELERLRLWITETADELRTLVR